MVYKKYIDNAYDSNGYTNLAHIVLTRNENAVKDKKRRFSFADHEIRRNEVAVNGVQIDEVRELYNFGVKFIETVDNLDLTPEEQVAYVYAYLVSNTTYSENSNISGEQLQNIEFYGPYSSLIVKRAVCSSIAYGFSFLLNILGIDCSVVSARIEKEGQIDNHAFAVSRIEGADNTYTAFDATCDIATNSFNQESKKLEASFDYFGVDYNTLYTRGFRTKFKLNSTYIVKNTKKAMPEKIYINKLPKKFSPTPFKDTLTIDPSKTYDNYDLFGLTKSVAMDKDVTIQFADYFKKQRENRITELKQALAQTDETSKDYKRLSKRLEKETKEYNERLENTLER